MIVAGFGFRTGAAPSSLRDAFEVVRADCVSEITALAAPADKAQPLAPLAAELGVLLVAVAPEMLERMPTATVSPASLAARRTGSVAEAAALAAAGPGARLLIARCVSSDRMATCAIAQGIST
ncbi:MAG: cobalamin biosynthesis protein [Novosphingobium sp.]|nr:cobalamin biosynthesis protein [Novosphingobium sp.]